MDVHAPFVGKRTLANKSLAGAKIEICGFIDKTGKLRQMFQRVATQKLVAGFLQSQICHHRDEIRIAAPFSNTVDGPLNLNRSCVNGRQ